MRALCLTLLLASCRERVAVIDAGLGAAVEDASVALVEPGLGSALEDAGGSLALEPVFVEARQGTGLLAELRDAGLGLVFSSERAGAPQLHRWDGVEERALTTGPAAHHLQDVAWRAGEALVSRVEEPSEQLIAVSLFDGGAREVAPPMEKSHAAVLSSDEQRVVFEASLTHVASVAVVGFDGREAPRPLGELGQTGSFQPAFTIDGQRVLFTNSSTGDPEVYLQPRDGGAPTQLTAFHLEDFGAVPSPDGQRFAFVSNREGSDRVFVQRLDGRGVARLMSERRGADDTEADPVWMPDGRSVLVTVRVKGQSRVARVEVASRKTLWTSSGPGNDQLPRPSPDGRFIAFVSDRAGSADVFVMRASGAAPTAVTSHAAAEYGPRWFSLSVGPRATGRP